MDLVKSQIPLISDSSELVLNSVNEVSSETKILYVDLNRRDVEVAGYGFDNDTHAVILLVGESEVPVTVIIGYSDYEILGADIAKYTLRIFMRVKRTPVETLLNLQAEIEEKAMALLTEIHQINEIDGFEYLDYKSINEAAVMFAGVHIMHCGCCSDEYYDYQIPTNMLFDLTARGVYLDELRATVAGRNHAKEIQRTQVLERERENDLRKIDELKQKHGVS